MHVAAAFHTVAAAPCASGCSLVSPRLQPREPTVAYGCSLVCTRLQAGNRRSKLELVRPLVVPHERTIIFAAKKHVAKWCST